MKLRHFIFRHYWWIALLFIVAGLGATWRLSAQDRVPLAMAVVATGLGFCYFAVQQKLAETRLFKELFTDFNKRYDGMNEALAEIASAGQVRTPTDHQKVIDYLNLCAEEFVFYREGYILPEVWRSWRAGMCWYLTREPFISIWDVECESGSYYGFSPGDLCGGWK